MSEIITMEDSKKIKIIDNSQIFKFIDPNGNDKLSQMSGFDLQDLIILINNYYIQLRNQLGIDEYITFGVELEFKNAKKDKIEEKVNKIFPNEEWIVKYDGSLFEGAEINSPILTDTEKNWDNLNKICSIVEPLAEILESSGGHIHIGTQTLGNNREAWLNFLKIWSAYENVIFRFAYGEFLTARSSLQRYAEPMVRDFWRDYELLKKQNASLEAIISTISRKKYQAVNFNNVAKNKCGSFSPKNTIEFRCPNGSLSSVIWQNNINLFIKMLCYCKEASFNDDIINQRHKVNYNKYDRIKWYDEIYLDEALEYCDLVFSNNCDKVYFLRQYLKSLQVFDGKKHYPKSKKITKEGINKNY